MKQERIQTRRFLYDCLEESSPNCEKLKELYLAESEEIDLKTDEVLLQEMRGKNYPFSGNANNFLGPLYAQGKKINRSYSRLKSYYMMESGGDTTQSLRVWQVATFSFNWGKYLQFILKYDYGTIAYTQ